MHNKKKNFIAIPKDAASIIILRERKGKIYVLMGKRPENSRFMPGVYVFPGGVLERKDYLTKNSNAKIPLIYPLIFYTGDTKYNTPLF